MEAPEIHAEMFIVVTYRPKWLLWQQNQKSFPMKPGENNQTNVEWKSIPR